MSQSDNQKVIVSVVGARPNFMKAAPVARTLGDIPTIRHVLVHTGQHYDAAMSDVFFRDLDLPAPDLSLGIGSGSHADQTARIMQAFETDVILPLKPSLVIIYGDVNSTVAAALVAKKLHIPVAHVESGLRSWDRTMPEEINRIVTDAICDLLFVTEESGRTNLLREGADPRAIHFVGNTMIDSLAALIARDGATDASIDPYLVLTLHRPSNVDDPASLKRLLSAIREGAGDTVIHFPIHPRTRAVLEKSGLLHELVVDERWVIQEPLGYCEFIGLVRRSEGVITDSGGIQEETTWLGIPCVTLRESTERPSTIEIGTNRLVGTEPTRVAHAVGTLSEYRGASRQAQRPPLWDGNAAERIAQIVLRFLQGSEA